MFSIHLIYLFLNYFEAPLELKQLQNHQQWDLMVYLRIYTHLNMGTSLSRDGPPRQRLAKQTSFIITCIADEVVGFNMAR